VSKRRSFGSRAHNCACRPERRRYRPAGVPTAPEYPRSPSQHRLPQAATAPRSGLVLKLPRGARVCLRIPCRDCAYPRTQSDSARKGHRPERRVEYLSSTKKYVLSFNAMETSKRYWMESSDHRWQRVFHEIPAIKINARPSCDCRTSPMPCSFTGTTRKPVRGRSSAAVERHVVAVHSLE
jgi:hypothetical protein